MHNKLFESMQKRGIAFDENKFLELLASKKTLQIETEELQNKRNVLSKTIGQLKQQGQDCQQQMTAMQDIKIKLDASMQKLNQCEHELNDIHVDIPNVLDDRVPYGKDEADNKTVKVWSQPKQFDFPVKDHVDLGKLAQEMNFEKASDNSRSRFVYLSGGLANLHRALAQWMLDLHIYKHGYNEVYVPLLMNKTALTNTAQLPKFAEDLFFTEDGLGLIPTAEVPLVGMYSNEIIPVSELPIKLVAHSPCFRSEAGSYGKDTRGMIRQHQFDKVELVQITHPDQAEAAHQEILAQAEKVLQLLDLPYRTILKCGADTGFHASITYDLEVWMPSQSTYREISSVSQCADFQARRMKCRYKGKEGKGYVHTLNGSGLAVGRTLVAILENYQNSDASITIPEVLKPYLQARV